MGSLGDRLRAERRRRFVGRGAERARFAAMLDGTSGAAVLWIHGPGGVGKTTLLAQLRDDAEVAGRRVIALDARDLDPEPAAVFEAIARALGCAADDVPEHLASVRHVLVLDTYELIAPLDPWIRDELVPSLPDEALVILAGRDPPGAWRLEPGLAGLVEVIALRNLTREESHEVLARRGVGAERQAALVEGTHGHPLALALIAEVAAELPAGELRLDDAPDVLQALLDSFVRHVPSAQHRRALHVTAEVMVTTEALLREILDDADTPALFEWLRGLSFVQRGPMGLFPHDLARDVLSAELRAQAPDLRRVIDRRAGEHLLRRVDATSDPRARSRLVGEMMYLHRGSPIMQQMVDFRRIGSRSPEPLAAADAPAAIAMLERRTGPATAAIATAWYRRRPDAFSIYRDPAGELEALALVLDLDARELEDGAAFDPALAGMRGHVAERGGLRDAERINVGRIYVHRVGGAVGRPASNDAQIANAMRWLSNQIAFSFLTMHTSTRWDAILRYMDHERVAGRDHELDGIQYALYAHDWRAVPRAAWFELVLERAQGTATTPEQLVQRPAPAVVALPEAALREAVRRALKDLPSEELLARNPLARSRAVREAGGLRALIQQAARALEAHPRDEKLWRALNATYLDPSETQELAAERLDVPFSTYRRHLNAAIDRIADWVWHRETG